MHFHSQRLDSDHHFLTATLPDELNLRGKDFDALWATHPEEFDSIRTPQGWVELPRWQRAYGKDYVFSGRTSVAREIPMQLMPYLAWARATVDARLNALLLNWYDGARGHYIGRHRDSEVGMIADVPIVTMSLGEERLLRFRSERGKGKEKRDYPLVPGTVVVLPLTTNQAWSHEVPSFNRWSGRRISITVRGLFDNGPASR